MAMLERLWRFLLGPPHDPLQPETRQHTVLVPFLAWVGFGANSPSSSCYGPEKAFGSVLKVLLGCNKRLI